ncbi:ABC transporter permease [Caproiciproducens sp. R2]|uniref:ABC transporter permease n=1 Tax=Caproiciproducens sp. R2 TaxID=3435187 RepID=UPI0040338F1B
MKHGQFIRKTAMGLVLPLLIVLAWFHASPGNSLVSSPEEVYDTIVESLQNGFLLENLLVSFSRVMQGFLYGSLAGLFLGILTGVSARADRIISPFFHAVRNVPIVGWIPLFIIWFGFGDLSEIMLIAVGAFFPSVLNTYQGIHSAGRNYVEVGRIFNLKDSQIFRRIVLPSALPSIATGIRISLSNSWMFVVVAEIFGVTSGGIGNMMNDAREAFRMNIVIMGIIAIGTVGLLLNQALSLLERRLLVWRLAERKP